MLLNIVSQCAYIVCLIYRKNQTQHGFEALKTEGFFCLHSCLNGELVAITVAELD